MKKRFSSRDFLLEKKSPLIFPKGVFSFTFKVRMCAFWICLVFSCCDLPHTSFSDHSWWLGLLSLSFSQGRNSGVVLLSESTNPTWSFREVPLPLQATSCIFPSTLRWSFCEYSELQNMKLLANGHCAHSNGHFLLFLARNCCSIGLKSDSWWVPWEPTSPHVCGSVLAQTVSRETSGSVWKHSKGWGLNPQGFCFENE